ncbi:DnaJ-class molecular chaperone [Lipingzhangella halophila]|uniref:DnaJ-class molecular chaperone n=1 Tax=Lipingzhangella halophila TaxID=1783352 RepID=A0A7W7W4G8_9ACTN|nr:DnaJ C-terminal domain-containing protein [Lipingzhangella halophila]MBB4933781.1 DnaJ-class molecular chaperone [Lipingzhangella halophila]
MTAPENPYEVLGIGTDATHEQIARAFRDLARRHHPDAGGDHDAFARLQAAYETLIERHGHGAARRGDREASRDRRGTRIPVRVRRAAPRRGADSKADLRLRLSEAVYGTTASIEVDGEQRATVAVPRATTHGHRLRVSGVGEPGRHGGEPGDLLVTVHVEPHPTYRRVGCDLRTTLVLSYPEAVLGGTVPITTLDGGELRVSVPPGTSHGDQLRQPGYGVPAHGGHGPGDLVVEIAVDVPDTLDPAQRAAIGHLGSVLPPPRKDPRR